MKKEQITVIQWLDGWRHYHNTAPLEHITQDSSVFFCSLCLGSICSFGFFLNHAAQDEMQAKTLSIH